MTRKDALSKEERRRFKQHLNTINSALRKNAQLKAELSTSCRLLAKGNEWNNKLTDHVSQTIGRNCSRVPYTNSWMESQLNRCMLILERGRRLQYVPPYYHCAGKPLTPVDAKRAQSLAVNLEGDELVEQPIFKAIKSSTRFSSQRDNGFTASESKKAGFKRSDTMAKID